LDFGEERRGDEAIMLHLGGAAAHGMAWGMSLPPV
jgi:hypothetical protein